MVYFHAIAWLIPLTLAIGTLAMKQVTIWQTNVRNDIADKAWLKKMSSRII